MTRYLTLSDIFAWYDAVMARSSDSSDSHMGRHWKPPWPNPKQPFADAGLRRVPCPLAHHHG